MDIEASGLIDGLAQIIPQFARRLLHVGLTSDALAWALHDRSGAEVVGIQCSPSVRIDPTRELLTLYPITPDVDFSCQTLGEFDGIILETIGLDVSRLRELVVRVAPLLNADAFFLFIVIHPPDTEKRYAQSFIAGLADEAGLAFYTTNDIASAGDGASDASSATEEPENQGYLLWAVRPTYNPLLHARRLFREGHPGFAYEVLDLVPDRLVQDPAVRSAYCGERMMCLLAWDKLADPSGRLGRFFNTQSMFYEATWNAPDAVLPFICQSEFWKRLGDSDMAARLLRTARHVSDAAEIERRLEALGAPLHQTDCTELAPVWKVPERLPRILFVMPPRPHYGLDVLYEGLCTVLGDLNVTEYPWKSTLHGEVPRELANYPCMFHRQGEPKSLDALTGDLRQGEFDLILMGDVEQHVGLEAMRAILAAAPDVPVFVVDEQDDPLNSLPETMAFMGRDAVCGYFKREMLQCYDYGWNVRPLPFAYADVKVPLQLNWDRPELLFWAGHRQFGLRRLYVENLERHLGRRFDRKYSQEEYKRAIQESRIGLNLFGFGFDTVRYWELAAHGCLVFSERLPIRIPHNFVDGESAVFFDDLPAMLEKLSYYRSHLDEVEAVARRGHEVFLQHHTASARARQLLAYADELLQWSTP